MSLLGVQGVERGLRMLRSVNSYPHNLKLARESF